jgi:hypothetical protein
MSKTRLGVAVLIAAVIGPAASAQAVYKPFQSPSGNIQCAFFGTGKDVSVRCDIRHQDNPLRPAPASCEYDYGQYYGVKRKGRARRLCVSDAVGGKNSPVIGFGTTMRFRGIRCTSTQLSLRCSNKSGHGFELNRSQQTLF